MARVELRSAVRHFHKLAGSALNDEAADSQLLQRFVVNRDEAAFATLVKRYGALVYSVCRRVLQQDQDAEDALQAAFLILARRAGSIHKRQSLASWLHGVAFRTALSARKSIMRRRKHEEKAQSTPTQSPVAEAALRELQTLLDEEVHRLPDRLRAPFVLCCWEGRSRADTAAELGWKEGTVCSRVAEARERLRHRLAKRGVTLTAALSACTLGVQESAAAIPLLAAVSKAAVEFSLGRAAASLPIHVVSLTEGVLSTMSTATMKLVMTVCTATLLIGSGIGGIVYGTSYPEQQIIIPPAVQAAPKPDGERVEKTPLKADDILSEAASTIRLLKDSDFNRIKVLQQIAVAQSGFGYKEAAKRVFEEVIDVLNNCSVTATDPVPKAFALADLARAQFKSGDEAGAKRTFEEGIKLVQGVADQDARSGACNTLHSRKRNAEISRPRAQLPPAFRPSCLGAESWPVSPSTRQKQVT